MKHGFDYPEKQVKIVTTKNQKNRKSYEPLGHRKLITSKVLKIEFHKKAGNWHHNGNWCGTTTDVWR
jgi:hypothetical protein